MSCRQEGLLTCCLVKQLEKQSKPMLFRLQNAANSLTSPTMTVPFDTDDCATIPRVGYQPVIFFLILTLFITYFKSNTVRFFLN